MDFGTHSMKRALSATEPTSSPSRKRARASPIELSKPILRLNCAVAPQGARPQPFLSPLPFSIGSNATLMSSVYSAHSSASFYQHQPSSQVFGFHNYQPQSYQPPPCRSPAAACWETFPEYQPASTTPVPYGAGYSFADMCRTSSISCSIYSGGSDSSRHVNDSAACTNGPRDARDIYIKAMESHLHEMKDTLAAQYGYIDELLKMKPLLGNNP